MRVQVAAVRFGVVAAVLLALGLVGVTRLPALAATDAGDGARPAAANNN